jgi:hypothetical protein
VLVDHPDGFSRALFRANAASFAIIVIYLHRNGRRDDPLGAIHPAKKTGLLSRFGWNAFGNVYLGPRRSPVAGLSGFSLAKFRSGNRKGVFMSFAGSHFNPSTFYSAAIGEGHRDFLNSSVIRAAVPLKNQAQALL